jgi:uncharacterized protein YecE (DUF72 family)
MSRSYFVGTAAWTIPTSYKDLFPESGTHLERYSQRLTGVEVNTSFYRDHQAKTYEKWAENTPENFRFAIKLARELTHEKRLECSSEELSEKLDAISKLGNKFAVLLVQLPPSLDFVRETAKSFFSNLRDLTDVPIAFEPRHPTWITPVAKRIFKEFRISKVVADPDPCETPDWQEFLTPDLVYHRLHGSPEIYRSLYTKEFIEGTAEIMASEKSEHKNIWCMFDNTAYGFATYNALQLLNILQPKRRLRLPKPAFLEFSSRT